MELQKIPPHDEEAEQAVIGSMLTDKDAVMTAVEKLKPDSFYREDNKAIFEAIINLYNRSEPVDLVTVNDELTSMGMFEFANEFCNNTQLEEAGHALARSLLGGK